MFRGGAAFVGVAVALTAATGFGAPSAPGSGEREPPVEHVADELANYGARSVFAYVTDGGHEYAAAAGAGLPSSREARFRVGSVTKTFVATIVLQLAEEGKLQLDDPVARYLPRVVPHGDGITLRRLLNHTSGLADYTRYPDWFIRADRSKTLRPLDVLRFGAAKPRTFARPGGSWSYSNTNYVALGLVIEKVTGHTLRRELAHRIVRPVGLRHTELARTRKLPGLRDPGTNPVLPWAAGGIVSTAADLARFFSALLAGRLVSTSSLAEMQQTVQDPTGPGHYGLGLEAAELSCGTFWAHGGHILDYSTWVTASADGRRVAVVLLRGISDRNADVNALLCA